MDYSSEILKKFLNLYWVRPETAFWRTLDVLQMKSVEFKKPILDIGCGDGSFSFTNFGGSVDYTFDVYRNSIRIDIIDGIKSISAASVAFAFVSMAFP